MYLASFLIIHSEFPYMSFFLAGLLLGFWGLPIGPVRTFQIFIIGWLEKTGRLRWTSAGTR